MPKPVKILVKLSHFWTVLQKSDKNVQNPSEFFFQFRILSKKDFKIEQKFGNMKFRITVYIEID